ncbi:saccharopine dehydrogenase NADP-binding domain-containing protein [Marinobacteraceae bacterium S3BR75-40.1]
MAQRKAVDIVLFGATGFTGELTATYLAHAGKRETFSWALAGRNTEKLARVRKRLESIDPKYRDLPLIEADLNQPDSLAAMAAQARVVVTTVGPYIHYGEAVVKACVEQKADYVDLTGEPEYVDHLQWLYDRSAQERKVRLVNCCGFDSIPHDLGVWYTLRELTRDLTRKEAARLDVDMEGFVEFHGRLSGGTWHSAVHAFSRYRRYMADRRAHGAFGSPPGRYIQSLLPRLKYQVDLGSWAVPFPTIDPQVIKRSAAALEEYGRRFRYGHYLLVKRLPRVLAGAALLGGVFLLAQARWTREWLLALRGQGQGPSPAQIEQGWFRVTFKARAGKRRIRTFVAGGDPGYGATSRMLGEAALCLALDRRRLTPHYGVVTPASVMAKPLYERLQRAGLEFRVVEETGPERS